jgi:outer membrane protein
MSGHPLQRLMTDRISRFQSLVWIVCIGFIPLANAQQTTSGMTIPVPAHDSATTSLTIDAAVALAQQNNPAYLQTVAGQRSAAAALRSAHGGLLPQLTASLTGQYQQGGQQLFNGVALNTSSDIVQSEYNFGLTYTLNGATLLAPRQARANTRAVDADVVGAQENLRTSVQQQYFTTLQSEARARLQDTLVENARTQVELARGRASVGSGTGLDVERAEVALRQQQVQQIQAKNQAATDRVRLFQQMGVPAPAQVTLTSRLPLDIPVPSLDALLAMAQRQNPGIEALRLREHAAQVGVTSARTAYTPTLTVSTGIGGYTYQYLDGNFLVNQASASLTAQREACIQTEEVLAAISFPNTLAQCSMLTLSDAQASAIRASNDQFPFHFTTIPRNITGTLSLPLFDGFVREQRLQDATVQRDDARYTRREHELALTADITAAYLTLQTARQTVALQDQNAAKARQELKFVQDQYTVGIATFVDLTTSRAAYAQAENDRITAIYDYHKAFSVLENAVGRPLR